MKKPEKADWSERMPWMRPPAIYTAGHSNLDPEVFLEMLEKEGIVTVADVRRYPYSRRHPHFGSMALAVFLASKGIGYVHLEALGGRRPVARESQNTGWEIDAFVGYADYMQTSSFSKTLDELERLAAGGPTVLICAEANWRQCHRWLIADSLTVRGWCVIHLQRGGESEVHELTRFAEVLDGTIWYPPAQPDFGV